MTPETLTPVTVPDVLLFLAVVIVILGLLLAESKRLDREQAKTDAALKRPRREEIEREHRGRS